MLKNKKNKNHFRIPTRKVVVRLNLYQFPMVIGLEDISSKLNSLPSENLFGALMHAFALKPICTEEEASNGERLIEYLNRAFETYMPLEIKNYYEILLKLLNEYDDSKNSRIAQNMTPQEFLRALLQEDNLSQKSLVPDCFHTQSQVSEFLHMKKGRDKLSYKQAMSLGKKFNVNPMNFLNA